VGITRLASANQLLQMWDIEPIAINKEFICIQKQNGFPESLTLMLYSRDFVLKGHTKTPLYLSELKIRGRTIIGLNHPHRSVEFWRIEYTNNVETSLTHFKSIPFNKENEISELFRWGIPELGLSHNFDTIAITDGFRHFYNMKKIAEFGKRAISPMGCMDMLSAQHFAVFEIENTREKKIIRFEVSNIRCLERTKLVSISVPQDLGALLDCKMYFTTIVLFFASGIARVRLKDHDSIYQRVASNSDSLRSCTRALEDRKDLLE
jgi:hypothetical protein